MANILSVFLLSLLLLPNSLLAKPSEHIVKMLDRGLDGQMVFEPAVLDVNVGDTVTFVPAGHEHDSISILTPEGANTWHGRRNQQISVVINKEGVYIYKCAPHFYFGMLGVIVAGKPINIDQAKQIAAELDSKFVANRGRLLGYIEQAIDK